MTYFISYTVSTGGNRGFGNSIVNRESPIVSESDLNEITEEIEQEIGKKYVGASIVILYFKEMR